MYTINGQSAAKLRTEEGSTTIETTATADKEVEYISHDGKGRNLNKIYIYALEDPITNEIRYIGKTNNYKYRYKQHINDKSKSYKASWIKSLNGNHPRMIILDEVVLDEWEFWETYWITLFKSWNFKLTNLTKGGLGHKGYKRSIEENIKISNKLKGRKVSNLTRKKLSESRIGIMFSKEHIKNLSESHKGLKYSSYNYGKHKLRGINQYDLEGNFIKSWNSIKEASLYYDVNPSSISHCCAGRKKSIKGFLWKYLN